MLIMSRLREADRHFIAPEFCLISSAIATLLCGGGLGDWFTPTLAVFIACRCKELNVITALFAPQLAWSAAYSPSIQTFCYAIFGYASKACIRVYEIIFLSANAIQLILRYVIRKVYINAYGSVGAVRRIGVTPFDIFYPLKYQERP
jgi:hypothetical protein